MRPDREVGKPTNGWTSGTDPLIRWLRAFTVIAFVVVFVIVALDNRREPVSTLTILGLAGGAVLILLGYAAVVRLPLIGRPADDDDDPEGERER
jgi:heme O synthase-like polyprenyltransferase